MDRIHKRRSAWNELAEQVEAIRLGLVDKVGNLDFVAREVIKAEEIIDYTPHDNLAERFAKRFGAAVGYGAIKALRELAPIR